MALRKENPGEWVKKEKAWKDFQDRKIELPDSLGSSALISRRAQGAAPRTVDVQDSVSDDQKWLRTTGSEMWKGVASWAKDTDNFQAWERKFMFSIGKQLDKEGFIPSTKQVNLGRRIFDEAADLGFIFSQ